MSFPTRKQTPRNRYTESPFSPRSEEPIIIDDSTTRITMAETESSESSSQQLSEYQNVPSNSQQLQSTPTTPVNNRNKLKRLIYSHFRQIILRPLSIF